MRISRSVMAVGGVAVAAAAIGFTNPKAVQAVTAALVQVTNTATNPVVTQGVSQQAGQIVNLWCGQTAAYPPLPCKEESPTTGNALGTAYTVPSGQSLVVTSIDITPFSPCSATHRVSLSNGPGYEYAYWNVLSSNASDHYTFPSGIVFAPGMQISSTTTDSSCQDVVFVQGYLTNS
ncbi:MAG TPA: hypothetical protein VGM11_05050 [Acidobacteriaceae bacterium]|jgi:hypothetical protein